MASSRGRMSALLSLCCLFSTDFTQSEARELRPSDHGLQYQDPPPAGAKPAPEMASFFGASPPSPPSSNSSASSPGMALPNAMNSSNDPWWRGGGYGGGGGEGGRGRRDRVRGALLVASIVCGITGIALLFASGLVFLFNFRKERSQPAAAAAPPPPPLWPPLPLPPLVASGRAEDYKK
ncbi:zinc finger protein 219-like isoform X1 [Rhodamnia argentea]|uniref:Zinc finger protein 219-like isoform X1 n=1 Tax=Rhodamnia argentea TaxID=178133 RepID=A0A8B8QYT4_9MYRT|nr:zinc finger protein 219-like isoform X1 [Rhodamnia argentea]